MKLIQPFRGLRPPPTLAREVSAPPYDVLNRKEAKALAAGNPHSILHVTKAEINLPEEVETGDLRVYEAARQRLQHMVHTGVLLEESQPCLYLYRLEMNGRQQMGLVVAASIAAYQSGRIKKHEFTRPDKEEDRTRLAEALQAHTGPVFLIHRPDPTIASATREALAMSEPLYSFTSADGIGHAFWRISDPGMIARLVDAVETLNAVYIADGHHRSAAAARVCERRHASANPPPADAPVNRFLSVMFPSDQVRILDYNRVVRDLNGHTPETFLAAVGTLFRVTPAAAPVKPTSRHSFGMYLRQRGWYELELNPQIWPSRDAPPQERLDVSLLSHHLLEPLLGIRDPRRDARIDFVGGIRGMEGLAAHVETHAMAVGFSLYPPDLSDLMQVADADQVMPPKSTWFEPKLRDGLIIQTV
ncbi:MAG: DUF1015 domain-containing protein [Magnetococcales bacterium]|nr:DUF1015 domain-containing protein [Magnetococcales bacterium]MBF0631332.1 DUF1015 domain-containing protein [Magnetococcales bacterium]